MRGAECDPVAIFLRSVPHIPQVWTRTRISPKPISGTGTSSRRTSLTPRYTAALIVEGSSRLSLSKVLSTVNVDDRAIAIAFLVLPLLLLFSPSMYLRPDKRMSASRLWSSSCWIQRVRQSFTIVSLTAEVANKGLAKCTAGLGAIPRQRNCRAPQPRAQRHMTRESNGLKASVNRHKAIHCRQVEIGDVRDDFQSSELDSPRLRSLRDGCGFHVHRTRAISFSESNFLLLASDGRGTH